MTAPYIPLSPQQLKQRRKNLLFLYGCAGVTLAIFSYLFFPALEGDEEKEEGEAVAAQVQAAAVAAEERANQLLAEEALSAKEEEPANKGDNRPTEEELAKLSPWEAAFMRLDNEHRVAFATAFAKAKAAYGTEQWTTCLALLNDCELIFDGSPNVWNLRACALLESNELEEAEACIARSLELNADDNVALMCRSELFMLRRDFRACLPLLERLRNAHVGEGQRALHDTFTFHLLLCHLMLRQEMEARALVVDATPLTDSPLYYFSQAAFCVYRGDSNGALEPLRSASTIYGTSATASYRKWMNKCGLADKYVRGKRD